MITNAVLVRWADGYITVTRSPFPWGRREGFLSVGNAPSTGEAARVAEALLDRMSGPLEEVTLAVEPTGTADAPYSGFVLGDSILVPDAAGTQVRRRVLAFTVSEDDEGNPVYIPELEGLQ